MSFFAGSFTSSGCFVVGKVGDEVVFDAVTKSAYDGPAKLLGSGQSKETQVMGFSEKCATIGDDVDG